jgi:hypothetical protein
MFVSVCSAWLGSCLDHKYQTRVEVTVTNTVVYNDTALITTVKCFIVQAPWLERRNFFNEKIKLKIS